MKKIIGSVCLILLSQFGIAQGNSKIAFYAENVVYSADNKVTFVSLKQDLRMGEAEAAGFINAIIFNNGINKVAVFKTETDELGFTHIKFHVLQNGVLLANKMIVAHFRNGRMVSINGDLADLEAAGNSFVLTEKNALAFALNKVNAKKYKWDNKDEEAQMRVALNDPDFSYAPDGVKVVFEKEGKFYNAYQFNIYAEEPLYRANVFVDAATGTILDEQNLICHADVPGTASTKYSGVRSFTVDNTGSLYRLRETGRGQGVETFNMKNTSTYNMSASADFTNATTNFAYSGADQGALDAHWGAEKTYDYYWTQHNRNSINNNGFKLLSFVHYQTNYQNAFWDGQRMTYGDGNGGSYKIFTALDVCGHEITHGLTSNTGNLTYSYESGALNESYSDIFGTAIENYARPTQWDWRIGEDIVNGGLRSMANPGAYGDPDTYLGNNYYTGTNDNGGVHTNSGVNNFWFYLLANGGSGTNDVNNMYSVSGIGMTNAARIAFRALTVYFTPGTNFANARLLTIQAAKDLFGVCSNEVIQTTRAWYAVNVGANYVAGFIGPDFNTNTKNFCSAPANVNFTNMTPNGVSYVWDFGDGSVSTTTNPVHSYTAVGVYAVELKAYGCSGVDSVTKTAYIVVNGPLAPPVVSGGSGCENAPIVLNGSGSSVLQWYAGPTGNIPLGSGNTFNTPGLSATTTFYAANTSTVAPVFGGILAPASTAVSNSNINYLSFNVLQPGVLNSVVVYAQAAGIQEIELRNSSSAVLNSFTVSLNQGMNTVPLNFDLIPGNNYRLGLSSTSAAGLRRNNSGVSYPYNIGGVVNIVGSSGGNNFYYFFYNWSVTPMGCSSPRVQVIATVNPAPAVSISVPTGPVCLEDAIDVNGTPAGGTYAGSMSGSVFTANGGVGTYTVSYSVIGANSCSNTAEASLIVQECTGVSTLPSQGGEVLIYPNPANDKVTISAGVNAARVVISDATGRVVLMKDLTSSEEHMNLDGLSNGMYIISVQDEAGRAVKTSKLVKE